MFDQFAVDFRVRRALKKQPGGAVSVPVNRSNRCLRYDIKESILTGKYNLGTPVLENEHEKVVVTSEGNIEKKKVKISARKYPLKDISAKALENNIKGNLIRIRDDNEYENMRGEEIKTRLQELNEWKDEITDDEAREYLKQCERTRNWLIWHDHSSIASSGFMLFLVRELYDPAVHLTTKETRSEKDLQSVVETPHLYMLGASGAKDSDQLAFIPTRRECLRDFESSTVQVPESNTCLHFKEKMRFMNGDNPANEHEDGTQKGGHYGCPGCEGDMRRASEYDYMAYQKYKTLEEKKQLVCKGNFGKTNTPEPFKNLKVDELKKELRARGKEARGSKKELQDDLTDLLRGTSRVPALLFGNENYSLKDLNIEDYEVLFFEPLHTCLNHIANLFKELPLHMTNLDALLVFKEVTSLALNKDKLRATDYRRALIKLTIALTKKDLLTEDESKILLLFCEMMSVYYQNDDKRNPRAVLRLYNISFQHGQAIQKVLTPPKAMTLRKLCGMYYHGAVDHAPLIYRLVSLRSTCAELFERYFDRIVDITRKTWNKHLEDLVPNAFLHIQAEDAMASEKSSFQNQEKEITQLAKNLPKQRNTVVPKELMTMQSRLWQSHIYKIADYIKCGPNVWWKWLDDGSVEFFDSPDEQNVRDEGPPLFHFRSCGIKEVSACLNSAWETCKTMPADLPVYKLRDQEGKLFFTRDGNNGEENQDTEETEDEETETQLEITPGSLDPDDYDTSQFNINPPIVYAEENEEEDSERTQEIIFESLPVEADDISQSTNPSTTSTDAAGNEDEVDSDKSEPRTPTEATHGLLESPELDPPPMKKMKCHIPGDSEVQNVHSN